MIQSEEPISYEDAKDFKEWKMAIKESDFTEQDW